MEPEEMIKIAKWVTDNQGLWTPKEAAWNLRTLGNYFADSQILGEGTADGLEEDSDNPNLIPWLRKQVRAPVPRFKKEAWLGPFL